MMSRQEVPMPTNDEIDIAAYFRKLARNWWLIVMLALFGALVGVIYSLAQAKTYDATSSVYLGQATDATGSPINSISSNPKAATDLLQGDQVLRLAAQRIGGGESASHLSGGLTLDTPTQVVKGLTYPIVNFVTITVRDTSKARAAKAANVLADILVEKISSGTVTKAAVLQGQIAADQREIFALRQQTLGAQKALMAIATGTASAAEKAAASASYVAIVQAAASAEVPLQEDLRKNQLMLITSKNVEMPVVMTRAEPPTGASGPKATLNALGGFFAGLVIGIVAAFARRQPEAAA
jgi:capsular polysaccharide biosynthesis protein